MGSFTRNGVDDALECPEMSIARRTAQSALNHGVRPLVIVGANQSLDVAERSGRTLREEGSDEHQSEDDNRRNGVEGHSATAPAPIRDDPVRLLNSKEFVGAHVTIFLFKTVRPVDGEIGGGGGAEPEVQAKII